MIFMLVLLINKTAVSHIHIQLDPTLINVKSKAMALYKPTDLKRIGTY